MYEFVILALGGALTYKTVDLLGHIVPGRTHRAIGLLLTGVVGVFYAYLTNFSLFASWDVGVRSETIGLAVTGLFFMAMADVWRECVSALAEWAHRNRGQAAEIETRLGRAA